MDSEWNRKFCKHPFDNQEQRLQLLAQHKRALQIEWNIPSQE